MSTPSQGDAARRLRDRAVPIGRVYVTHQPNYAEDPLPWKLWGWHPTYRRAWLTGAPTFEEAISRADRIARLRAAPRTPKATP